jgi:hypothetical protein
MSKVKLGTTGEFAAVTSTIPSTEYRSPPQLTLHWALITLGSKMTVPPTFRLDELLVVKVTLTTELFSQEHLEPVTPRKENTAPHDQTLLAISARSVGESNDTAMEPPESAN